MSGTDFRSVIEGGLHRLKETLIESDVLRESAYRFAVLLPRMKDLIRVSQSLCH
jgi:hypothetical protein